VITVTAQRLLRGVQELLYGVSEDPSTEDFPVYRAALDMALAVAWESEWWQSPVTIEERYFRATWLAASTYNKTDEVYDSATQKYYQCLRNSVTGAGNSPTDSAGDERSAYWALCSNAYSGANWASGIAYAVGDIKFYPPTNRYYQCHTAHTSSSTLVPNATGGDERWGVLTQFLRSIDFEEADQTEIGEVVDVKDADPRATRIYGSLEWDEQDDTLYVHTTAVRCWVVFRRKRPSLTGALYDSASAYAVGDQVYFEPSAGAGQFYNCIATASAGDTPATDTDKWELVEIPRRFEHFLICQAAGMTLTADQEDDRRNQLLALAEGHLARCADVQFRQSSRTPTLNVRTYR
jgi:hypothetical protein